MIKYTVPSNLATIVRYSSLAVMALVLLLVAQSVLGVANAYASHLKANVQPAPAKTATANAAIFPSQISLTLPSSTFMCKLAARTNVYQCMTMVGLHK